MCKEYAKGCLAHCNVYPACIVAYTQQQKKQGRPKKQDEETTTTYGTIPIPANRL